VPRPHATNAPAATGERAPRETRPLVTVIVPVYNQAGTIVDNVRTIRERVETGLGEPVELIVVSDGSVDASDERLLEDDSHRARVIHYDRNLGKGFAIKAGALAASGRWISYVDADLDLDPAAIPEYVRIARDQRLDFVIGSKRHPASDVHYPPARRLSSWLYQQLVRALFDLRVRDTQVGLKVFRREVAEDVFPLLLVKQYAFDLELLAVAHSLGFDRLREMPVSLQYRFSGSGVRSVAVLYALVDTAAIFYRLHVLRYYQRKREMLQGAGRALEHRPRVTVITGGDGGSRLEYPDLEVLNVADDPGSRREAAERATGEVLAFLSADASPAGNWLDSAVPFLARPEIAAVVASTMAPVDGSARERAAAAVWESRLGGGSTHFRFTPGNLRFVEMFPAATIVVRRADYLALPRDDVSEHRLTAALVEAGKRVVYTPDTVVVSGQPPLFRAHLAKASASGRGRGVEVREHGPAAVRPLTLAPLALLLFALGGWPLAFAGRRARTAWAGVWALHVAAVLGAAASAALRYRSKRVGALTAVGSVATHLTFATSFLAGLLGRRP
jgi:glycosyltransferase involved in cell wall biosynthesis